MNIKILEKKSEYWRGQYRETNIQEFARLSCLNVVMSGKNIQT